jgi:hypothetical protein
MQTVLGADRRSYLLDGLLASTIYSVVVHPFYGPNSVEGSASNVVYLQTSDDGMISTSSNPTDRESKRFVYDDSSLLLNLLAPFIVKQELDNRCAELAFKLIKNYLISTLPRGNSCTMYSIMSEQNYSTELDSLPLEII